MWEHFILNELHARCPRAEVSYWRDKQKHEVDFVLPGKGKAVVAIECKWSSKNFDVANLKIFRDRYVQGENWIVCADVQNSFDRREKNLVLKFLGLDEFAAKADALCN